MQTNLLNEIFGTLDSNDSMTIRKGGNCMVLELETTNVSVEKKQALESMGFKFQYVTEKSADKLAALFYF